MCQKKQLSFPQVFLTGQTPFPEGTGGAVYMAWPPKDGVAAAGGPAWQFLGVVTNEKPSAIFKVSRIGGNKQSQHHGFTSAPAYQQVLTFCTRCM